MTPGTMFDRMRRLLPGVLTISHDDTWNAIKFTWVPYPRTRSDLFIVLSVSMEALEDCTYLAEKMADEMQADLRYKLKVTP